MMGPKITVTLERLTAISDSGGGYTYSWTTIGVLSGTMRSLSGDELVIAQQLQVSSSHAFYVAYPGFSITEKDRIISGGITYSIIYAENPCEKNWYYKLYLSKLNE